MDEDQQVILKNNIELLRNAFFNSKNALFIIDLNYFKVLECNQTATKIFKDTSSHFPYLSFLLVLFLFFFVFFKYLFSSKPILSIFPSFIQYRIFLDFKKF